MKNIGRWLLLISLVLGWRNWGGGPVHAAPPTQEAGSLVRVYFGSQAQLQTLAATLDVWEVQKAAGYLLAQVGPRQLAQLHAGGLRVEPQAVLYPQSLVPQIAGNPTSIPNFPCYRTVEETFATLANLAAAYPNLAQTIDIGDSWRKQSSGGSLGYDLWLLRLTSAARNGPKARLFILAETHARELATSETALRLAETLLQNYGSNAEMTWLLDENEIYILPMANPDGRKLAETGLYWRKNVNPGDGTCSANTFGVDLNRNTSYQWGGEGASPDPCDTNYYGVGPASEPETQALQNYLTSLFPDRRGPLPGDPAPLNTGGLLISLHSYGGMVLWPYGWTADPAPNQAQLASLGQKLAFRNGYNPIPISELYLASGGIDDWAYGELGLSAFTIEMGTAFFETCASFESTVWPANRSALLYAAKAARRPYQTPAGPEVLLPQFTPAGAPSGSPLLLSASVDATRSLGGLPQTVKAARFTLDAPSWNPAAHPAGLTPLDGAFDSGTENIRGALNTCGLASGQHTVFLEGQAADGSWGVPSAVFFTVMPPESGSPLRADQPCQGGQPGSWVTYAITVQNPGSASARFTLSATTTGLAGEPAPTWETSAPTSIGPLGAGEKLTFSVQVHLPAQRNPANMPGAVTRLTLTQTGQLQTLASLDLTTTPQSWRVWLPAVQK